MGYSKLDLASLIGSRICHDLISPIGAINNGLELLSMAGGAEGPEIMLIRESVDNANARIRYFRIAYGVSSPGQTVAIGEVMSIIKGVTHGGRIEINWHPTGELLRTDVQAAFLAIQCLETALPYGGSVDVTCTDGRWTLSATGKTIKAGPKLWTGLSDTNTHGTVMPSQIQFVLLPQVLASMNKSLNVRTDDTAAVLTF